MLNRFLVELIDDAGLFPPAKLPMAEALRAHDAANTGRYHWMVGRFIVPASRLEELWAQLAGVKTRPLIAGVILDGSGVEDLRAGIGHAKALAERSQGALEVEVFETKLPQAENEAHARGALRELMAALEDAFDERTALYVELPPANPVPGLHALAEERAANPGRSAARTLGAKIRCGGLCAELFPEPAEVARFIGSAAAVGVPFKATAGLHHPVRRRDAASGFMMHGFVNVGAAAVFAHARGAAESTLCEIVCEEDAQAFALTPQALRWRDLSADRHEIEAARRALFHAYGSCSIAEPVEELVALAILA